MSTFAITAIRREAALLRASAVALESLADAMAGKPEQAAYTPTPNQLRARDAETAEDVLRLLSEQGEATWRTISRTPFGVSRDDLVRVLVALERDGRVVVTRRGASVMYSRAR